MICSRELLIGPCLLEEDFRDALRLTEDYLEWLDMDLSFQGIEEEMSGFRSVYRPPDGLFLLARAGDRTAGGVGFRRLEPMVCEMKRLFVRDVFRGAGLGRLLCSDLINRAGSAGYHAMRLDTLQRMGEAVSLYRSLGFREIGPYRHNPDPTAKYMELRLSRH